MVSALQQIYGGRVLSEPAQVAPYESDALTVFRERPRAVVLPENQQEVIETVRLCHRENIPFVARGSGTSLSGGSLPIREGIVIGLNRLNHVLKLDPRERIAVVEPGVINLDISSAAGPHGLYYAPDPSSQSICTIGGNVAFNSGGAHCLKHGMTSNHVLGIKAVLPDGEVVMLGGTSLESTGPDLKGIFVGSEGRFGIALEITVRLLSKPEAYKTVLAAYKSLEAAGEAVSQVVAAGMLPGAMEIMDHLAIEAAEAAVHAGYPLEAGALLIVELEGEQAEVQADFVFLEKIIEASGPFEVRVAQDEADRMRIWKGRKSAFSAVGRLSPDYIVQDGVVPRSRLAEALADIGRLSTKYGIRVANVFHAGDGNLHPLILFDGTESGALERAEELAAEIVQKCIDLGGSITGEHGVGMEKRAFLAQMFNSTDIAVMERIRSAIDPAAISNRGKMFPDELGSNGNSPAAPRPGEARAEVNLQPTTPQDVQDAVCSCSKLVPRGGGSKSALSSPPQGASSLDLSQLSGVIEYDPAEFTFIALAGTPVSEVETLLAKHGQYLPFDPILVKSGATLGGTVASGASGPGRYRHGGIRDFLLGVHFVSGEGELVRGGGKVVKNAAGFDLPKLMVGSTGRLGVLVQLAFKVFPRSEAYTTLQTDCSDLSECLDRVHQLNASPVDLEAVDLDPSGRMWVRIGGRSSALRTRVDRLRSLAGGGEVFEGPEEAAIWESMREFGWIPSGSSLVKIAVAPDRIPGLEEQLKNTAVERRYSVGGNVCWLGWPGQMDPLQSILKSIDLTGLVLTGSSRLVHLGNPNGQALAQRLEEALDPAGRFS